MAAGLRGSGDEEVRRRLEQALAAAGEPAEVAVLARRAFAYETSFAIDELRVELADGERLALLAKDVGESGLSGPAAATKPPFTLDHDREIVVYRDLLAGAELGTPRFHGAAVDAEEGRRWIFLELVEGEVLTDVGELRTWCEAAAWAAGLDRALKARPEEAERHLLHRGAEWHGRWIDQARGALPAGLADRLGRHRDGLVERLEALPRGFVHGELYPSNVLVGRRPHQSTRIAAVDWELAGTGPYPLDLAALVGGWGEEERLAMCLAFAEALPAERRPSPEELAAATDLCRLALALQWIGWAPDWRPPQPHRHDWAAEATEILDGLGLA
jgi:Phosphotransferase enzyme family